jgi:hypothetical protein
MGESKDSAVDFLDSASGERELARSVRFDQR